ncbi:MAG: class I SAM-dependent methyltransferase [Anaerolineales bacterium]
MGEEQVSQTQARYDRIAPVYDLMEFTVEKLAFEDWRAQLWSLLEGQRVLEVGVGTGKNLPYHRAGSRVTAVDLSPRMLVRAQQKASESSAGLDFVRADAQHLPFATGAFESAVATFVFCSVPDPVQGLREVARVVRPGGQVLLLEHVRVNEPVVGPLMDLADPLVVRLMGAHINRQTEENVRRSGLKVERVEPLAPGSLVKLMVVRAP